MFLSLNVLVLQNVLYYRLVFRTTFGEDVANLRGGVLLGGVKWVGVFYFPIFPSFPIFRNFPINFGENRQKLDRIPCF